MHTLGFISIALLAVRPSHCGGVNTATRGLSRGRVGRALRPAPSVLPTLSGINLLNTRFLYLYGT